MNYIKLQAREEAVILTITKEKALNALSMEILTELKTALNQIDVNKTRGVVITGAGEKSFVAGADIRAMKNFTRAQAKHFSAMGSGLFRRIETYPLPVIAAVNGYALGGGLELALACDIRIASDNAVFGLPEAGLGITPGFGGTQRLMRLIPCGVAKEMIYTGKKIDAGTAEKIGLINGIYYKDELLGQALRIVRCVAKHSPQGVKACKKAMQAGIDERIEFALAMETDIFSQCFETPEQTERMQAFLQK